MGLISLKCTNCGGNLSVDESLETVYCQYCGNKMLLSTVTRTENKTIIRDEAAILNAQNEAKLIEAAAEETKKKEKHKKIKFWSIAGLIITIGLAIGIYFLVDYTKYGLIGSESFTGRAFNITKEELLDQYLAADTRSETEYGLVNTGWVELDRVPHYISATYNKMYNNEKRYTCDFYLTKDGAKHLYYSLQALEDNKGHIIACDYIVYYYPEIAKENTSIFERPKYIFDAYFSTIIPGEVFSILTGKTGDYVNKQFDRNMAQNFVEWSKPIVDGGVFYDISNVRESEDDDDVQGSKYSVVVGYDHVKKR